MPDTSRPRNASPANQPHTDEPHLFTSADLAAHLAAAHPNLLDSATARTLIETIVARLVSELAAGNNVRVAGFGDFRQTTISARHVIVPSTGDHLRQPATRYAAFRGSTRLRRAIALADGRLRTRPGQQPHPEPPPDGAT